MNASPAETEVLLSRFRQALADITLSDHEARQLRAHVAAFQQQGGDAAELRRRVFQLAKEHSSTPLDKGIINWLHAATALLPDQAAPGVRHEVHFSPGEACVGAIRRFIAQAERQLDVCVFTVADDRLTEALLAAHRRGVRVRLLTDNDKLHDVGSDVRQLHRAGVAVRTDRTEYHMHHKFAVADHALVLTGSYNWTRSAALYNLENVLITDDPALVQPYDAEFARLWQQLHPFGS
ncbi:phospholipase D-like domain-containing protein [Hymenobacter sp. B81]|uniref:phospholipase D-like domain-containing protein n=1 Tax=Hymenobacter sp. B81 TaxID=3344878 RepID=UPI0037DC80D3